MAASLKGIGGKQFRWIRKFGTGSQTEPVLNSHPYTPKRLYKEKGVDRKNSNLEGTKVPQILKVKER